MSKHARLESNINRALTGIIRESYFNYDQENTYVEVEDDSDY